LVIQFPTRPKDTSVPFHSTTFAADIYDDVQVELNPCLQKLH